MRRRHHHDGPAGATAYGFTVDAKGRSWIGASVDVQGKVWLVDQHKDGGGAFVYDPITKTSQWVGCLDGPYTYSDMTGVALKNVASM